MSNSEIRDSTKAWRAFREKKPFIHTSCEPVAERAFYAGFKAGAAAKMSSAGKRGGAARAKKLTAEQRSEIARNAAKARWSKRSGEEGNG